MIIRVLFTQYLCRIEYYHTSWPILSVTMNITRQSPTLVRFHTRLLMYEMEGSGWAHLLRRQVWWFLEVNFRLCEEWEGKSQSWNLADHLDLVKFKDFHPLGENEKCHSSHTITCESELGIESIIHWHSLDMPDDSTESPSGVIFPATVALQVLRPAPVESWTDLDVKF